MIKVYKSKFVDANEYVVTVDNLDQGIRAKTLKISEDEEVIYDYENINFYSDFDEIEYYDLIFNKELINFLKKLKNFLEIIDVDKQIKIMLNNTTTFESKTNIILKELKQFLNNIEDSTK